jgi:hypothetical protein
MKHLLSVSLAFVLLVIQSCASSSNFFDGTLEGKFEAQDMNNICSRTGLRDSGVQCVRVWANEKDRDRAYGLAKRYAVAAILLKGVSGNQSSVKEPLIPFSRQQEVSKWIMDFFQSDYLTYLDQAEIEPNEVFQIKGGYRVGINAKVNYQRLKQRLMDDGVLTKVSF